MSADHVEQIPSKARTSRDLQEAASVAFLGPSGTYSEEAVIKVFGDTAVRIGCASISDVFGAVAASVALSGVVPFENSAQGPVAETLDLLADTGLPATSEVVMPIVHCMLPNARELPKIDCVLGHSQALAQCRKWLDRHLPGVERRAVSSNAAAVKAASESDTFGAPAGERTGRLYGVEILCRAIQDEPSNSTRFLIVGGVPKLASGEGRTLIRVEIEHCAGSLVHMLEPLEMHGISIEFFEMRPLGACPWSYYFFLELAGYPHVHPLTHALHEMAHRTVSLMVLGSYASTRVLKRAGSGATGTGKRGTRENSR